MTARVMVKGGHTGLPATYMCIPEMSLTLTFTKSRVVENVSKWKIIASAS